MTTSSSCLSSSCQKFDVFLSFRGVDTRDNFVSHLYDALQREGIRTFKDDSELDKGESISAIFNAIQRSSVSLIILSRNYASSPFCLDEVVKIMECTEQNGQKVVPIFYEADPSDVESQSGSFGEAFAEHEEAFKDDRNKVHTWRTAFTQLSKIGGWESTKHRPDSKLIKEIVNDVLEKLKPLNAYDMEGLVKLKSQHKIIGLLSQGGHDQQGVEFVGIWGMSGIGKTSIARAVFNKISSHFEGSCFLENVKESIKQGREKIQQELVAKIFYRGSDNFNNGASYSWRLNQLRNRKVLVVLDDVDHFDQLEILAGNHEWFGEGSRIIVTSRDRHVLDGNVDKIFEVQALTDHEALSLFSHFAFKRSQPKGDYLELSKRVVSYAKGIPLVLKVLGSFLYGRNTGAWESALNKYVKKTSSKLEIYNALKMSFDGLDPEEQQLFLHISCFFKGAYTNSVICILDTCGFSTLIGLNVLQERALIVESRKRIEMHDLLQDMGREIVHQESIKEPGKRSRLWNPQDIRLVLTKNKGTEAVESIILDQSRITNLQLGATSFSNMTELKLLKFHNDDYRLDSLYSFNGSPPIIKVQLPQGLDYLSDELRYLKWNMYPSKHLPSSFHGENLVELDLSGSLLERLWTGEQDLPNLQQIILRHCIYLIELPYLTGAPNLEWLDCTGCTSLLEVSPSIQNLKKLFLLDLTMCTKLTNVPSFKNMTSLHDLKLLGCSNLDKFPEVPTELHILSMGWTAIEEIPASIRSLTQLQELYLPTCNKLRTIPSELFELESLQLLCISGPYVRIEESLQHFALPSLHTLSLQGNDFESIPAAIKQLKRLRELNLDYCQNLKFLPELPQCLRLSANNCVSLETIAGLTQIGSDVLIQCYDERLWFLNCFSLDEKECRDILMHTTRRILVQTNEAVKFYKNSYTRPVLPGDAYENYKPVLQCTTLVPGDEIPPWIQENSVGSSITIQLTDGWCNTLFLDFALCVIVEFKEGRDCEKFKIRWEGRIEYNNGECNYVSASFDCSSWSWPRQIMGKHILFMYNSDLLRAVDCELDVNGLCRGHYNRITFEVSFLDFYDNEPVPYIEILNCGVIPIHHVDSVGYETIPHTGREGPNDLLGQLRRSRSCEF